MYENYYDPNSKKYKPNQNNDYPHNNYYGAYQKDYGQQKNTNTHNTHHDVDNKFKNTKNKIKVTMYKNGFILNNGQFRDKSIPENRKFMEEVGNGLIPEELINKGIKDLGILLENRKNEVYTKKKVNPITAALSPYIKDSNNSNNLDTNLNDIDYNLDDLDNLDSNVKIRPPIILEPGQEIPYQIFQDPYLLDQHIKENEKKQHQNKFKPNDNYNINNPKPNNNQNKKPKNDYNNASLTPIWGSKNKKNVFVKKLDPYDNKNNDKNEDKNEDEKNYDLKKRESLSAPKKKEEKKIKTFASLIREEKIKEEEEKERKKAKKEQNNEGNKEEKKSEEKKFQAFTGAGQLIGNVKTEGLHIQKDIKNEVDRNSPICTFNVRLFNGDIVKCEFNYTQTLREIYFYIQKISGSKNFHLLDGFPPKPLREYNKLIRDLNLDNTILTQKIKET